jgi:hypothetical protein
MTEVYPVAGSSRKPRPGEFPGFLATFLASFSRGPRTVRAQLHKITATGRSVGVALLHVPPAAKQRIILRLAVLESRRDNINYRSWTPIGVRALELKLGNDS